MKLIVFDLDGVLVNVNSSWRWVHQHFEASNDESLEAYLKGEIDDLEFMHRDIAMWKERGEIKIEYIKSVLKEVPLMNGGKETINKLQAQGIATAIVSGGIDLLAERVRKEWGIDYCVANGLCVGKEGVLTGEGILRVALVDKAKPVKRLMKKLGVKRSGSVAVGNSHFDLSMLEQVGFGIAFNPSDTRITAKADVVISEKDLRRILPPVERFFHGRD